MTEREKVMQGLGCLTHVDEVVYKRECEERQCPYRNTDCEIAVMEDAYNLLTQMTMDECCMTCKKFDEEWLYCWRYGTHAPKDGKCDQYQPKEK